MTAPLVSVVMGTYNDADLLPDTIDSVLQQDFSDFEYIIVNDGSTDPEVEQVLSEYEKEDSRVHVIHKKNEGLTRALVDGCDLAKGKYIARIDVGDVMTPNRLASQVAALEQYTGCVFVSSHVQSCAPEWEELSINKGKPETLTPVSLLSDDPEEGLNGDIPHHGSVMFRKDAYTLAGGYRWQFYYGQDWDLWYRLAEIGSYFICPEVLYKVRIMPDGISMMNPERQRKIAACSLGTSVARQRGEDESGWLEQAKTIRPSQKAVGEDSRKCMEPGYYFIGSMLAGNQDVRCRYYFYQGLAEKRYSLRCVAKLVRSFFVY